ncbi:MAG: response regulator, partial [Bacteroidota bacterium]|nr:response regulator [Bacteroidota bacterium]
MKNKILAIDDNKFIIELIQEILSEDKYDVHSITDSTYVYDYVKNNLPDLILLDVMMPETDGFELCEILKNNDKTKHIPIIFTTALDAESDIGRGFELGAADYITKPFNFFEFKSRVDNQLKIINSEKVLRKELKYRTIIEERYRLAQQAVGIGVWEWDILKNNISLSTVSFQIFGIEETKNDEVSYIRILKAVHYLDRRKFISQIATAVKDKLKIHVSEYRIVKDKEIRIIHKTSKIQYNKEGNPIKIIGVIRDITDEKKHEVELIKLSEAVKQSANTIVFTDTDGNIEYVNPKFTEVTGYTFDEALGQNPRILKSGVQ